MTSFATPGDRYFDGARPDLLEWLGGRYERILEIGPGRGGNADWLRSHGAERIVGIELHEPSAEVAWRAFDEVLVGDATRLVETLDEQFDLIICADVIEHLVDPWAFLRRLRILADSGSALVVSIPNIRFYRALWQIAVGAGFRYESEGTFDRTHLRFFTAGPLREMLIDTGWLVARMEASPARRFRRLRGAARAIGGPLVREWRTYQWFIEARAD